MRAEVAGDPTNYVENVWLYRYNDMGFVKAVFDPAAVRTLIDADPAISEPDDILRYADTHDVAGKPLILYASQGYTYYNPYVDPILEGSEIVGIPPCYDTPPVVAGCFDDDWFDSGDPNNRLPLNACDGEALWKRGFQRGNRE